jgi:hypothetical protein
MKFIQKTVLINDAEKYLWSMKNDFATEANESEENCLVHRLRCVGLIADLILYKYLSACTCVCSNKLERRTGQTIGGDAYKWGCVNKVLFVARSY